MLTFLNPLTRQDCYRADTESIFIDEMLTTPLTMLLLFPERKDTFQSSFFLLAYSTVDPSSGEMIDDSIEKRLKFA
jgi:hypothetical protein